MRSKFVILERIIDTADMGTERPLCGNRQMTINTYEARDILTLLGWQEAQRQVFANYRAELERFANACHVRKIHEEWPALASLIELSPRQAEECIDRLKSELAEVRKDLETQKGAIIAAKKEAAEYHERWHVVDRLHNESEAKLENERLANQARMQRLGATLANVRKELANEKEYSQVTYGKLQKCTEQRDAALKDRGRALENRDVWERMK